MAKLSYKIIGRRSIETSNVPVGNNAPRLDVTPDTFAPLDAVDVEWTHADGPFPNHKLMVERRVNPVTLELEDVQVRVELPGIPVIRDQINVRKGTPDSLVIATLEEKRHRLAAAFGIEP